MKKHRPTINFFRIFSSLFGAFANFLETIFDGNIKREKNRENLSTTFRIRNTCSSLIESASVCIHDGATVISHRPEWCRRQEHRNNYDVSMEELHLWTSWINGLKVLARTAPHLRLWVQVRLLVLYRLCIGRNGKRSFIQFFARYRSSFIILSAMLARVGYFKAFVGSTVSLLGTSAIFHVTPTTWPHVRRKLIRDWCHKLNRVNQKCV